MIEYKGTITSIRLDDYEGRKRLRLLITEDPENSTTENTQWISMDIEIEKISASSRDFASQFLDYLNKR